MAESESGRLKVVLGPKLRETLRNREDFEKFERDLAELEIEFDLMEPSDPSEYHRPGPGPTVPPGPWPPNPPDPPPLHGMWKMNLRKGGFERSSK